MAEGMVQQLVDQAYQQGKADAEFELTGGYNLPLSEGDQKFIRDLLSREGGFFGVTFLKRTNGKVRDMNCRTGVYRHLTPGGKRSYDPATKNLLPVWDRWNGYRCIPFENIISLRLGGVRYQFA